MELEENREALRAEVLPVGATFEGRLWELHPGHPDRVRLLSATASLSTAVAAHPVLARTAREGAVALIDRIDATLTPGGARDEEPSS